MKIERFQFNFRDFYFEHKIPTYVLQIIQIKEMLYKTQANIYFENFTVFRD